MLFPFPFLPWIWVKFFKDLVVFKLYFYYITILSYNFLILILLVKIIGEAYRKVMRKEV